MGSEARRLRKHACVFRKTDMASARFVPPETTLEAFIEEQANKNTLSKTKRDVSLLKEFMRMKGKDEEFENIEPRELDEILCAFILAVQKRTEKSIGRLYPALTAIYGRRVTPQPS